jgi:Domain of unknown function (DUF3885)
MNALKQEFQDYISKNYPGIDINTEHTVCGPVTLKFNTTEDEAAEFADRINQGVERGSLLWNELFHLKTEPLWIIAYEYYGEQMIEYNSEYLYELFASPNNFVSITEMLTTRYITHEENGEEILEKTEGRIILGKLLPTEINISLLLRGIANNEGGIDPMIGQTVYFFDPINHTAFHMYDDRGFYIWSTIPEKIKEIYNKYNDWIPDYTKEDIEEIIK